MPELPAPLVCLFADQRESLNERYALRLRGGARIESAAFLTHLRESLAPVLMLVHARFPERTPAVLTALYDASLDLFTASLLGPGCKLPQLQWVWTDLLPGCVELLAREPTPVVGSLCNSLYQIAQQRGTKPELWLTRMQSVLPHCAALAEVIDAGLMIAWQSGMPQYRETALVAADRMKPAAAAITLGLADTSALAATLDSLKQDRWHRVGFSESSAPALLPVAQAGSFVGFGGLFTQPPRVCCADGRLMVTVEDTMHWEMIADSFGVWFRRSRAARIKPAAVPRNVSVDAEGTVHWGKLVRKAPHLAHASSVACDGVTLAVTIPTSHHLFLFALTRGTR